MPNQPVNVYGVTCCYSINDNLILDGIYDGFGYKNADGSIIWYEGYIPRDDAYHSTSIHPYGNNIDLKELK